MPPKDDADRFRRIRDKQIAARDPMTKVRKLDQIRAQKQQRHRQSFSLSACGWTFPRCGAARSWGAPWGS